MPIWRVDSFHLGLGVVGDSAIHLLVQGADNGVAAVKFAVLVDGGAGGALGILLQVMKEIETSPKYDLSANSQKLQFDAIVVSHWDADHFFGVLAALADDILFQAGIAPTKDVANIRVSFLKYDNSKPVGQPLTILYCPAYGIPTKQGVHFDAIPADSKPVAKNLYLSKGQTAQNTVNNVLMMRSEPTVASKTPSIIGTNIFTATDLTTSKPHDNPTNLIASNPPPNSSQPGLYIIAASKRTIRDAFSSPTSAVNVADGVDIVQETKGTQKNESSVACMVIWPGSPARLSHYFAGDMHWTTEEDLVAWSATTGDQGAVGSWVTTAKLSHHGSKSSTPVSMLTKFNPRRLIASVAERNGHPSWELVFYLTGWMYSGGLEKAASQPFLTTQFPYYLIKQRDANNVQTWLPLGEGSAQQMSMKIWTENGKIPQDYRNDLAKIYKAISGPIQAASNSTLNNPYDDWVNESKTTHPPSPREWARDVIAKAWPKLSPVPPTAHAGKGVARAGPSMTLVSDSTRLLYFRVTSRNDNLDGSVWVKYNGKPPTEQQLWPDPNAVPASQAGPSGLPIVTGPTTGSAGKVVSFNPVLPRRSTRIAAYKAQVAQSTTSKKTSTGTGIASPSPSVTGYYNPAAGTNPDENSELVPDADSDIDTDVSDSSDSEDKDSLPVLKPLPLPDLQPGDPTTLATPNYFICASSVQYDTSPGPTVSQLADTDPLDDFLSTFHMQGLVLTGAPTASVPAPLHSQDEFLGWIAMALDPKSSTKPSIDVTTGSTPADIEAFAITVLGTSSTFTSAATNNALGLSSNLFGPASTIPVQNALVLGLEKYSGPADFSLAQVLAPATSRGASLTALQLLSTALGSKLNFNIDTSTGSRNALWFEPMMNYATVVRSQYVADQESIQNINSWIGTLLKGFQVQSLTAITKLTSTWTTTAEMPAALNSWEFILVSTVALDGVPVNPTVVLDFAAATLTITLQFDYSANGNTNLLSSIMAWIGNQASLPGSEINFQQLFDGAGSSNFDVPLFRRLVLVVDLDSSGNPTGVIEHLTIDLELGIKFGAAAGQTVIFLFTYEWAKARGSVLRGTLWTPPPPPPDVNPVLLPGYEPHLQFEPSSVIDPANWAHALDLMNLVPSGGGSTTTITTQPDGVPTDLVMVVLELDSESIHFAGALECDTPQDQTIPKLVLSRLELDATYTFAGPSTGFDMKFLFGATMNPPAGSTILPIELRGEVDYGSNTGWGVVADVETPGMQGAHFLDYFDPDSASAATVLIQHIQLLDLHLEYRYQNGKGQLTNPASSFTFSGTLLIGLMELEIDFNYPAKSSASTKAAATADSSWSFAAHAGAHGQPTTIQAILESIVGDGSLDLPSCVGDILVGVPPPANGQNAAPKEFFSLMVQKLPVISGLPGQDVVFTVSANVGPVSFTFLQLRNTTWTTASKRLLRVEVNALPEIDVPIIGNLTQPFDEMYFMWVQDGSQTTTTGTPPGFTKAEIATINKNLLPTDPIYYKLTKKYDDYADTDVLVEAGCHFTVVLKDQKTQPIVVLDYVFAKPTAESPAVPSPAAALRAHAKYQRKHGAGAVVPSRPPKNATKQMHSTPRNAISRPLMAADKDPPLSAADAGGGTTKAAMKKSIGPFQISNLGIRFSNSKLSVCLDAEVVIGPIAAMLMGFSIDLDFSQGFNLQNNFPTILNGGIGVSLKGLAASFDRPPLTIAGGLVDIGTKADPSFAGGIIVGVETWKFIAAGGYAELTKPGSTDKFRSLFVFAKLDGPLVTLEFAVISGVTGGFGYNNALTLPTVAEVPRFPFLAMPTASGPSTGNPTMDVLMSLINSKWFNPLDGSNWVAAGLTVSAFEMLDITAVAVVEWGEDVKMGIYALAVADIPSTVAPLKLAHIELGILAMVDFGKGIAKFEAQLAPSSYILDKSCHLSGGFALYYWFKDGPAQTKGDWVFTVGGYHPLYTVPPQYPVPPRLQISWSLGPVSIVGNAYFAITPNMAMAGTKIHASLSIGVLDAFFDAFADFIINYNPFTFVAQGGVSVGVRFSLDLLFVTIHISVEIGATLTMRGPPVAGTCHVNFWVFGFDIDFGAQNQAAPAPILLEPFYELVLQKGGPSAESTTPVVPVPMTFIGQTGLISPSTDPIPLPTASHRVAEAKNVGRIVEVQDDEDTVGGDTPPEWEVHAGTFTFSINCVFALSTVVVYPGGISPVVLNAPSPETNPIYSRPMYLESSGKAITSELDVTMKINTNNSEEDYEPQWKLTPIIKNVPRALWDAYDSNMDPTTGPTAAKNLATSGGAATVPLMMGVLFTHPDPVLSEDKIQPFDAIKSQLSNVLPMPPFPNSTNPANSAWIPAPAVVPPPTNPAQPWINVQQIWNHSQGADIAAKWTTAMGWTTGTVDGSVPPRIVAELQQQYVAAPMISAAVAA